jgi:hypothetical protein
VRYTSAVRLRPAVLLRHAFLLLYLFVTVSAFLYTFTITALRVPGIPYLVLRWAYGMMAPYQGDNEWNRALLVEARLPDGTWTPVDISRYMPYGFGERNAREFFRVFEPKGDAYKKQKIGEFASQILAKERARGMPYAALRVSFEDWPRSPGGFEHLRHDPFIDRTFLIQVP